jgi:hypothetical protein
MILEKEIITSIDFRSALAAVKQIESVGYLQRKVLELGDI